MEFSLNKMVILLLTKAGCQNSKATKQKISVINDCVGCIHEAHNFQKGLCSEWEGTMEVDQLNLFLPSHAMHFLDLKWLKKLGLYELDTVDRSIKTSPVSRENILA